MALIAVALLVTGTFYCVIYADIERGTENADSANVEFDTVDDALERAKLTIRSELGSIVTKVSSVSSGTLVDRSGIFGEMMERMFEERFPNTFKGVTTEVEGHDLKLGLRSMRMEGTDAADGMTRASYLTVSGTVTLLLTSESTSTRKTITMDADATSALPLVAEAATMFELSAEGDGSVLCQMVEYQLNALATNRVINGYGQRSVAGSFGTSSIITEADVERAIANSVNILEAMYFRDCPDGELLVHAYADLGDMIVLDGGCLVIDLGALFSQALMEKVDEYAIQWLEYLGLDNIVEAADTLADMLFNLCAFIYKVFTDGDLDAKLAVRYIKYQMSELGYKDYQYRFFVSSVYGESVTLGPYPYTVEADDDVRTEYSVNVKLTVESEYNDLFLWDGWGDFMRDYRDRTNPLRELLSDALKTVAMSACEGAVVRIPLDPYDSEGYAQELERCMEMAVSGALDRFVDGSITTVKDCDIPDPVMTDMYRTILDNKDEIFHTDIFEEMKDKAVEMMMPFSKGNRASFAEQIRSQMDFGDLPERYKADVEKHLEYLSIFLDAKKRCSIALGLASTVGGFLRGLHLEDRVRGTALELVREMIASISVNPYSAVSELPGTDRFVMEDGNGVRYTERLRVFDTRDLDISITDPIHNMGRNTHYIGFYEDRAARYSSVFTVNVKGSVDYTVSSTNPIFEKLALSDCIFTGHIDIDATMDIACMSGYALSGVSYQKSSTIFEDASGILKEVLARMMERLTAPMEYVMKGLELVKNVCTTAVVEYGNFMNRTMQRFYEAISVPLDYLEEIMDDVIQDILSGIALEDICIMLGSQSFVFDVFGLKVTIETDLRSLEKNTKNYVRVTAEKDLGNGSSISATLALKEKPSIGKFITVSAGARGGDWAFFLDLDPMFSSGTRFASISGHIRDVEFSGSIPELVQYQTIDVSTDDIPGVRETLNNIVLPAIGYKASLELGLYAKYDLPVETGLVINEVELNPEGNDSGNEWAELYNNTDSSINLLGYTLVPSGADRKAVSLDRIILEPHERTVVYFGGQALRNDGSGTRLTLYDTYGREIDRTPTLKDSANNDRTWQRTTDASVNWSFMPGTEDSKNNGDFPGGTMLKTLLIDFAKDAAVEVLDEMGDRVEGAEMAIEYAERVMARIVEKFIDCVSKCLVEACAFVKFELTDYSQSQHYGMKIMLGVDSELISDVLRYIASMLPVIGEHISSPEGLTGIDFLYKDVFLRTMVYTGISAPKLLGQMLDDTQVDAAISVRFNISAATNLFGGDRGDWKAEAGIVLENIPTEAVPSCFNAREYMKSDLWLFKMTFTRWNGDEQSRA